MRLLIGGSKSKLFHLKEFCKFLQEYSIECKVVHDIEIYSGFPSKNINDWLQTRKKFNNLIEEFKPDAVLIDNPNAHFGLAALKANLPLIIHLRGDYWSETKWARETLYNSPHRRAALWYKTKIGKKCFQDCVAILPLSDYLSKIVKDHYPNKLIETMYQGINPSLWYPVEPMELKHPCVGLLQDAIIWGKTREMVTLTKVLEAMPHVTFYWAGDGPYRKKILPLLRKYENFKWLGRLDHPNQVRKYLIGIDVYALVSGFDTLGMTSQEAALMEKPIVASNVGGIPESLENKKTGFLVNKGDYEKWVEMLTLLLSDQKKAIEMGRAGRKFVKEKFSWDVVAKDFASVFKTILKK